MAVTMTLSEARASLSEVLDRVGAGDEITITRHGKPVAIVVRPDTLRSRRADRAQAGAERVRQALEAGRRARLEDLPWIDTASADALLAEVRAGRRDRSR